MNHVKKMGFEMALINMCLGAVYSGAIVTHGISIFSVGYLRRHCTQDTWQLGIVSRKAVLVKPRQYGH